MNRSKSNHESDSVDAQRAQYERFSMTVCRGGVGFVNVKNLSYGDDSGSHIYSVEVNDGHAVSCSCPHHVHRDVRCKHIRTVENSPLVCSTANVTGEATQVATDGGTEVEQNDDGETCDRCPTPLSDVHDTHEATVRTTDGEHLCPDCADARSGAEKGFVTNDDESDDQDRGVTNVGSCERCGSYTYGGDRFCSESCRQKGGVDETPL